MITPFFKIPSIYVPLNSAVHLFILLVERIRHFSLTHKHTPLVGSNCTQQPSRYASPSVFFLLSDAGLSTAGELRVRQVCCETSENNRYQRGYKSHRTRLEDFQAQGGKNDRERDVNSGNGTLYVWGTDKRGQASGSKNIV